MTPNDIAETPTPGLRDLLIEGAMGLEGLSRALARAYHRSATAPGRSVVGAIDDVRRKSKVVRQALDNMDDLLRVFESRQG